MKLSEEKNGRAVMTKQNRCFRYLPQLNNVFNAIFLVYIPAIEVAMNESNNVIETTEAMYSFACHVYIPRP